jgi:ABC-type transport system involved in multi-copper enzyme maturation permease subunit
MVALGLAVSAATRRARTSWVVLLLVWIVVVLVAPPASEMIAGAIEPTPTDFDVRQAKTTAILQLEAERARKVAEAWREGVGSDSVPGGEIPPDMMSAYTRVVVPVDEELARKKRAAIRAIDEDRDRSLERRQRIARAIGRFSPAAVYAAIAGRLAGTGSDAAARWTEQVEAHQARLQRATFDREFGVELFPRHLNYLKITWWPDLRDPKQLPPDYDELPPFTFREEQLSRSVDGALPDIIILAAGAAIALSAALVAFSRTDLQ